MKNIQISVLMPVFNGEQYLGEAIASMLGQTFPDFELIIINDGSTDGTENIILSFEDPRIRYVKNEQNIKLIATLNRGLALCTGKYIARMDADDIALPHRLQTQFNFMEQNPAVGLCGSWIETLGAEQDRTVGFRTTHGEIFLEMLLSNHFNHPTAFIRREVLVRDQIEYPNFLHAEDYAMWLSIASVSRIHILPEVLLRYRLHGNSVCNLNNDFQVKQSAAIRQHFFQQWGIDCTGRDYTEFENWIIEKNSKQLNSKLITRFLTKLYFYVIQQKGIDKFVARQFFKKHTWRVMCEKPSIRSYLIACEAGILERGMWINVVLFFRSLGAWFKPSIDKI